MSILNDITQRAVSGSVVVKNEANGDAYRLEDKAALAQLATTGCLSGTYYASSKDQMKTVVELAKRISDSGGNEFLAKLAVYARKSAFMKDMPAFLLSILAVRDPSLYEKVFPLVMDNAKMVRNHVKFIRSGQIDGRKSLPRAMRRQIKNWFAKRNGDRLFKDTVGNDPSIADVIKMVRPKPESAEQEALYSYIIGKKPIKGGVFKATNSDLPALVKDYENCKKAIACNKGDDIKIPDVPFQMLDSLGISDKHWAEIARNARWHMTRMNLNTFNRHGVFNDKALTNLIANRLRDKKEIKKAKAFPYQLMAAFMNATDIPFEVIEALQDAMDISAENIPKIPGIIKIFVDISGSMSRSITGFHYGKRASKIRCIDVAALIASSFLKVNRQTEVVPFDNYLHFELGKSLNPRDSIMTNTHKLQSQLSGGTNISLGVEDIAKNNKEVDLVIYVSDQESWLDCSNGWNPVRSTRTMKYWDQVKKNNPNAKMVCIDLQPYTSTQAPNRNDILNIGGFSDAVWDVIAQFAQFGHDGEHWIDVINKVNIPSYT